MWIYVSLIFSLHIGPLIFTSKTKNKNDKMTTYMQEELEMEEKPINTDVRVCYDR